MRLASERPKLNMSLKNFVFCLFIAIACAIKFDLKERIPDNNPDLNREDLGAMEDAWKVTRYTENDEFYLMHLSDYYYLYANRGCMKLRTSDLNEASKSARYNMTWYEYNRRNRSIGQVKSETNEVKALKQDTYSTENILRFWYTGEAVCEYEAGRGPYNMIDYENYDCNQRIEVPENDAFFDSYVVFNQPLCFILRVGERSGVCEFWLNGKLVNQTLEELNKEEINEKCDDTCVTDGCDEKETKKNYADALFRKFPENCRLAFLLNCGYSREVVYNKTDCEKVN